MRSYIAFSILLFAACSGKQDVQPPVGVMSRDSMVQAMATMHIVESRIMQFDGRNLSREIKSAVIQEELSKSGIDTMSFNRSFDWYALHPDLFSAMYDDILSEISRRQEGVSDKSQVTSDKRRPEPVR
ncbi:MAG: DUF4296 domain-containing protein [Bacteroidota bacterium]